MTPPVILSTVVVVALLGGAAHAQQASGPPIPITPPASVYTHSAPSASSSAPPSAVAPRAPARITATAATRLAGTAAPAAAKATAAADIVHATAPGAIDCGQQLVVWANPATHIYHFSTSDFYGRTKVGSYMCESDAKAEGMRSGRTEVRP